MSKRINGSQGVNGCERVSADVKYETPYRQIYPAHKEGHWSPYSIGYSSSWSLDPRDIGQGSEPAS